MSTETLLGNLNLKDWSMIILLASLAFVFGVVGVGLGMAIINGESNITFTGSFDLGEYQTIITGIAMVAVVLIGQQLTSKVIASGILSSKNQ